MFLLLYLPLSFNTYVLSLNNIKNLPACKFLNGQSDIQLLKSSGGYSLPKSRSTRLLKTQVSKRVSLDKIPDFGVKQGDIQRSHIKSIEVGGNHSVNLDSAGSKCFAGILICCLPLYEFLQESYGSYCFCSLQVFRKEKKTWNPVECVQFLETVPVQLTNCLYSTNESYSLQMVL